LGRQSHWWGESNHVKRWRTCQKQSSSSHTRVRARWIWRDLRSRKAFMGPRTSQLNRVEAVPLQLWMKRTVLLQFTSLSTILLQYSEPPAVLCNIKYCNILAVKYILMVSSRIGWFESSKNRSFFAFFESCRLATLSPPTVSVHWTKARLFTLRIFLECK
jgi:hypothetical protein